MYWTAGSNRTFMELKFVKSDYKSKVKLSSNRTFMELKYHLERMLTTPTYVLIAPLWN